MEDRGSPWAGAEGQHPPPVVVQVHQPGVEALHHLRHQHCVPAPTGFSIIAISLMGRLKRQQPYSRGREARPPPPPLERAGSPTSSLRTSIAEVPCDVALGTRQWYVIYLRALTALAAEGTQRGPDCCVTTVTTARGLQSRDARKRYAVNTSSAPIRTGFAARPDRCPWSRSQVTTTVRKASLCELHSGSMLEKPPARCEQGGNLKDLSAERTTTTYS